ncbi:uncharacterized protein PV09_09024 [Verruconis gallopava]|uniref:Zn(2)-C6 fungal-type domain-containing protein n=1 Tax=Verruconis gallopava TaxID=253628 RepID=A0A0D2AJX4_9PEZI|nr:uncharacterized protein PV09_09024 [Verruconis gallopava]KIV99253.1 hypothetical protein PV09_09024 [Verruconis gallopava]
MDHEAPGAHQPASERAQDSSLPADASSSRPSADSIGEALLAKRRARPQKVCRPCRLRKVKCSYEIPCQTCIERGHPELCQYVADPPAKRVAVESSASRAGDAEQWAPSKQEWDALQQRLVNIESLLVELKEAKTSTGAKSRRLGQSRLEADEDSSVSDTTVNPAILAKRGFSDDAVYLGGNSVPAMVTALANEQHSDLEVQNLLSKSVLPIFGLDNDSATYPFVDLWGIPHGSFQRIELLCKLLPATDGECIRIFKLYRDTPHVIFPGVVDIAEFESDLLDFLRTRATTSLTLGVGPLATQVVFGKSLHWLGLLFAILGSGIQSSELPRKERQMKSQVYVCCAYECLRIVNYYTQTTLEDLQILLVLGKIISNNMNAGTSWSLLGLTIRLAQTLGLHYDPPSTDPNLPQTKRSSVWWQIVWQDSLLSITFDRTSPTTIVAHQSYAEPTRELSYLDCMRRLCKIGLDIVQERSVPRHASHRLQRLVELRDQIQRDWKHAKQHLLDIAKCRSERDMLEYWNLYLHRSFILSELCRPSIQSKRRSRESPELLMKFREMCIENLANTVDAFLGLHNITRFAMQSWAAVHRALSSALLLGILGEALKNARVQSLLTRLSTLMSDVVLNIDPSEMSAPLARSVEALSKLAAPPQPPNTSRSMSSDSMSGFMPSLGMHSDVTGPGSLQSSPDTSLLDEDSPFSILNTIFWGAPHSATAMPPL